MNRLTFWLSNSIVLRAIVSQGLVKAQVSNGKRTTIKGGGQHLAGGRLSEKDRIRTHKDEKNNILKSTDNWEDPHVFMVSLEKFEAWIFSRIVESVWWQVNPYSFQFSSLTSSSCLCILSLLSSMLRSLARSMLIMSDIVSCFLLSRILLHICSLQLRKAQAQGKEMEERMVWVIRSRVISLLSCGRRLSKVPVKGFVLFELAAMSVAACLC